MSDKSWEPGSFLMFSYVFQCFLTFSNVTYSHSHSLSLSHSLTLSHSHTLSISHWITLDMLNNFCFHLYPQNSLSHSLTLSLSLLLTLTLFQSLIQSLSTCWTIFVFMSRLKSRCLLPKIAMLFFDIITIIISSSTLSCEFGVHRAGSQLKKSWRLRPLGHYYLLSTMATVECVKRTYVSLINFSHFLKQC